MAKDILNEPRNKAALDAVRCFVPTMPLPTLPPLQNGLWRIHSSARGAPRREFELLEGEEVTDYERLEHVGDALLGAEVTLLIHEKYPKLSAGARTVRALSSSVFRSLPFFLFDFPFSLPPTLLPPHALHLLASPTEPILLLQVVKSVLVCNLTLSLLAVSLHLEKQIQSAVAQAYANMTNPYIQACVFESWVATLYEEHGAGAVRAFLRAIYSQLLPIVVEALRPFYTSQAVDNGLPSRNYVGASTPSSFSL